MWQSHHLYTLSLQTMTTTYQVRRLGVGRTAIVFGALYLIFGIIFSVLFAMFGALIPREEMGLDAMMFGGMALIIMPLMYAVFGLITGFLVALFYNLVAGMTGGLELELVSAE